MDDRLINKFYVTGSIVEEGWGRFIMNDIGQIYNCV
jgi:hypothetical protein